MSSVARGETVVLAGTRKGLFVLHSRDRKRWRTEGPFFEGAQVRAATMSADGRTVYAAATSEHWGPTVARSQSFGARWQQPKSNVAFPKGSSLAVSRVWNVTAADDGTVFAGTEPAGLFRSDDDGATWSSVDGLNLRKDRAEWQPGGGGLCLHTILPYPGDSQRMIAAASSVGVFGTKDAGASWRDMNGGVRSFQPDATMTDGHVGSCPHKIARDPRDPRMLYMQNHLGVYRRRQGEDAWKDVSRGLPSRFGFPLAVAQSGAVFVVPLAGDFNRVTAGGAMAVWRSRNEGRSWTRLAKGLPQKDAYYTILREGLAVDGKDPEGVYVGTTTGQVFASRDEGDSWARIADGLPQVVSVSAGTAG